MSSNGYGPFTSSTLGHVLNEFVRNCAVPYLEDDHADVRRAAATTCCRLFVRDPICYQSSSHAIEVISEVLDKLLTVGIADPGIYSLPEMSLMSWLTILHRCRYQADSARLLT